MGSKISNLWDIIATSDKRIYYTGKKTIFLMLLITGMSFFYSTVHSGDIVDIIWTNLYIIGPSISFFVLVILFLAAFKENKDS